MFADDIDLLREISTRYEFPKPIVDIGGLPDPCIADYKITIEAMAKLDLMKATRDDIMKAQMARYQNIHRPLSFLDPEYKIENPEMGGPTLGQLASGSVGTAILLSVLEHVSDPFEVADDLHSVVRYGGLVIVSVPFSFPEHHGPEDCFRYTPTGLRHVFEDSGYYQVLECDWRLRIPASAGVIDVKTWQPHAIETCYLVARAK